MTTEIIKEFVNNSELPQLQKNVMNGFIDRAKDEQERKREDRQLIEQVANEKKLSEVILSTDEVKIYTVRGEDEWDIEYPYRSIYLSKKGTWEWERTNTVSPTFDLAFLVYLQYKHLGSNSQFVDFAMKMLEIPNRFQGFFLIHKLKQITTMSDMRTIALNILEDEMSENTLRHIREIDYLENWIVDAMINFHESEVKKLNLLDVSNIGSVVRTERGWAGHFICSDSCRFRRNTLLAYNDIKIVVSSVGLMLIDGKFVTIGHNRYFETMAFHSDKSDTRYHDADVSKKIYFDSDWAIAEIDADDKANEMHEAVVLEITNKLLSGETFQVTEQYLLLPTQIYIQLRCMRRFAQINFQVTDTVDSKLSYTPCYALVPTY